MNIGNKKEVPGNNFRGVMQRVKNMSINTIGAYLKKAREEKNLSQKSVAAVLNYKNINFISMIESGVSKIPVNKIMEFVKAYQLPPFFGYVIIREVYGDIWNAMIETEKINPQLESLYFKELDKKIGALYKKELKIYGIKNR